eukprot:2976869-Amphidinium_carterae.1
MAVDYGASSGHTLLPSGEELLPTGKIMGEKKSSTVTVSVTEKICRTEYFLLPLPINNKSKLPGKN